MITKYDDKVKIKASFITKRFELIDANKGKSRIRDLFFPTTYKTFWALRNVSFEMKEGECIGVIGLNGAGKSTLSNIISEQIAPTTGQIDINGEVSIIAAGAGMQNNISGRENIRLKGLMLGMKNKEIKAKMQEIIDFSELGPFIDQPVKTYSSGMRAKLGFSIMVHQDPDIMIIDEGLSVGDKTFVDKAQKKMFEFRDKGKTILLVSHDMRTIKEWCDRVIWLNHGEVKAYGRTDEVLPEYEKFVNWFKALPKKEQEYYKKEQRQAQFDYSVEELKKEIVSQSTIRSRRIHQEVNQVLKQKKDNHKLSSFSKLVLGLCVFVFLWISLVSMSNTRLKNSVKHPIQFFSERLFKARITPEEKEENNVKQSEKKTTPTTETPKASEAENKSEETVKEEETSTHHNPEGTTYIVQVGDSLGSIAESKTVSIDSIQAANPDVDFNVIHPGQEINIPQITDIMPEQLEDGVTQQ
ncbi:ATP-binding cassette domain-containing protein [Lactococcus petauri]|uniref:ATP-binding cassette domain-containing protein n=1 Tax=Lactococcus petauri TaxID=1940789 RepID=UPI00385394AD